MNNNGNNTSGYDYFTAFKWATKLNKYYLASLFDSLALIKDNGCKIINGNVKNSSEVVDVSIKKKIGITLLGIHSAVPRKLLRLSDIIFLPLLNNFYYFIMYLKFHSATYN